MTKANISRGIGSTVSRAFEDFAIDEVTQGLFMDFVSKVTTGRIVPHRSIDLTEIDAREKAATKEEKSQAESDAAIRAQVDANADDYNALSLQCERDKAANLALLTRRRCHCEMRPTTPLGEVFFVTGRGA